MSQFLVPYNVLLVSENKLKAFTDIDPNVTSAVLLPWIQTVQATKLEYIIGGKYYKEILTQVQNSTLTQINENFLFYYIQPMLIWAAYAEALPSIWMRIRNNGITVGSENPVSVKEMQWQQTRADDRSQFFEQRMIDELIWNSNDYPSVYSWSSNEGLPPHLGKNYYSGIHLSNGNRYGKYGYPNGVSRDMVIYGDPTFYCCGLT